MTHRSIVLQILDFSSDRYLHCYAKAIAVTHRAQQLDLKPVIGVAFVVKEKLRPRDVIGVILTIRHEKIEEAVIIVIAPGGATTAALGHGWTSVLPVIFLKVPL